MTEMILHGGYTLRTLRAQAELSLVQAEAATTRRYGDQNKVRYQQISRIEKGQMEKPPIIDLIRLGGIYGLSAEDIGDLYGLWPRQGLQEEMDPRLKRAVETARTLADPRIREDMLAWIEFAVMRRHRLGHAQQVKMRRPGNTLSL